MRRGALVLALLVMAALGFVLARTEPAPSAIEVEAPAAAEPDAASAALSPSSNASTPAPGTVTFKDGFCAEPDMERFQVRYSLARLVRTELQRRLASGDDGEDTQVLLELSRDAQPAQLYSRARQAALRSPDSPWPQLVLAIAASAADQYEAQVGALRRARQLLPRDPALGLAIAQATADSGDLDEAIDGLSAYLAVDPAPEVSRLRARYEVQRDIQRGYQRVAHDGVTLMWPPGALPDRVVDELSTAVNRALDDAAAFSGTQRRQRLTVVVYPSRSELLAVTCARTWTAGMYDGTLRLIAPADDGPFDWKALRHETLHAQVAPLAPRAPRWFHEGAAQSFAQQTEPRAQWSNMVRNRVWIPFSSLDGSFQAFASADDAGLAYAQSYAMVELMRALKGDAAIAVALRAFQAGADTPAALARACGKGEVTGADLLAFLERRLAQE